MARNPYIERYKAELSRTEQDRQSYLKGKTIGKVAKGIGIAAGVLGGVHIVHPKGIIGALDTLADDYVRSGLKAIKQTDFGRHVRSYLRDQDTTLRDTFKNIGDSYTDQYRKILRAERERVKDLQIEQMKRRSDEIIRNLGHEIEASKVHQKIVKRLDRVAEGQDSEVAKQINKFKTELSYKLTNLANVSQDRFKYELRHYNFSDKILKDLYQNIREEAAVIGEPELKTAQMNMQRLINEHILKSRTRNQSFINKLFSNVTGYKRASARDLMKLNEIGEFDIQKDTLEWLRKIEKSGHDMSNLILDDDLYIYKGKLVNAKKLGNLKRDMADLFSDGLIGRILYLRDIQKFKSHAQKPIHILRAGYHQPILSDMDITDENGVLKETVYGIGDKIYRLSKSGNFQLIKENVYFTSGRFGRTRKLLAQMSGVNAPDWEDKKWYESKRLDIARRREPGFFGTAKAFFNKFGDDEWTPNRIRNILMNTSGELSPEDKFFIQDYLEIYAHGFSDNTLQNIVKGTRLEKLNLSFATEEDIIESYRKIINEIDIGKKYGKKIKTRFENQYYGLMDAVRVVQNPSIMAQNELQTGIDILRKDASKIIIGELSEELTSSGKTAKELLEISEAKVLDILYENLNKGRISQSEFDEALGSIADYMYERAIIKDYQSRGGSSVKSLLHGYAGFGRRSQLFGEIITDMTDRTHPWHSAGPVHEYYDKFHASTLAINKTPFNISGDTFVEQITSGLGSLWNIAKGTFTHGRKTLSEVNTWDLFVYSQATRINDILKRVDLPLALSDDSLGSTGAIITNMFFKRIFPVMAGIEAIRYINDYSSEYNEEGYTLRQRYERAKAATRLGIASIKDSMKITDALKWLDEVTPGSENLSYSLGSIPVVGWTARWAGLFSTKSHEEWVEYYLHGEDPVRKGRHWLLGSGPWMGEKIEYYKPNSYRMAMSEWEYTDTVYGSREEYWSHHWLPTPRHPFAPIRRFITDRYWFENMHKKDRPYPLSGQMFDPNTPWGWVLNNTVGRILKPVINYGAGATKADLKKQREEFSYQGINVGIYSGGDIELATYTLPQSNFGQATTVNYALPYSGTASGIGTSLSQQEITDTNIAIINTGQSINSSSISIQDLQNIYTTTQDTTGQIRYVNKEALNSIGVMLPYRQPLTKEEPAGEVQDPTSIGYQLKKGLYLAQDIMGATGFLLGMPFGNEHGAGEKAYETADMAYAPSSRLWNQNLGGLGGNLSEAARRLWNHPRNRIYRVNNLPNMMPDWLPSDQTYFIDFQHGDPYRVIDFGEIRLPGEAYESLHQLHPDQWGRYGAVDRAAILADVAPYSQEFKMWLSIARSQGMTEEEKAFLNQALEQSKAQKERYFITPYKFLNQAVERKTVHIKKFIDQRRFVVAETNEVYSLAGVTTSFNSETEQGQNTLNILSQYMMPGTEVEILVPKFPGNKGSIPAVVYHGNKNINRLLIESGLPESESSSPVDIYARMGAFSRFVGRTWERFAHAPLPLIHNKFISVDSPEEHYKRTNLYGKEWQDWNHPIRDYVKPTFQSAIAEHPVWASAIGGTAGYIMTRLILPKNFAKAGSIIGATAAAVGSVLRAKYEMDTGKAWIPKRREKQWEIEEYFDILEYLKNKRLFLKYKELAEEKENIDLDSLLGQLDELQKKIKQNNAIIQSLENRRFREFVRSEYLQKKINKEGRLEYVVRTSEQIIDDQQQKYREQINEFKKQQILVGLGPYAIKVLEYREKYKSTLYALDETSTQSQIYVALPKKARAYFKHFSKITDPEEREELLKLLPENQRRAYKIAWGQKPGRKIALEEYFKTHYLPGEDWIGWREGVQLEDSMIKVVEEEGLDISDFGIWKDYSEDEQLTPTPYPVGHTFKEGTPFVAARIRSVLQDYDLDDIEIEIIPREDASIGVNFDINYDVTSQVKNGIYAAMGG